MKKRFAHISRCDSGIAILITLAIITILIAVTLEINRRVRAAVATTSVVQNRLLLSQVAASGVHAAMALLVKDRTDSDWDGLHEDWASDEKLDEMCQAMPFGGASLSVHIVDELPTAVTNILYYNPLAHSIVASRNGFYDTYESTFFDPYYYIGSTVAILFIGIAAERYARARILANA